MWGAKFLTKFMRVGRVIATSQANSAACGNAACGARKMHTGPGAEHLHDVTKEREQAGDEAPQHNQECSGDQADQGVLEAPHRGLQENVLRS